jgi:hypothetical protein
MPRQEYRETALAAYKSGCRSLFEPGLLDNPSELVWLRREMKCSQYFEYVRQREDRRTIQVEWIERVIQSPERQHVQADGRIRRWARIEEAGGRDLRVALRPDGETIPNAFFDRSFTGDVP